LVYYVVKVQVAEVNEKLEAEEFASIHLKLDKEEDAIKMFTDITKILYGIQSMSNSGENGISGPEKKVGVNNYEKKEKKAT